MIQRAGDGATADHLRVGPGSKAVGHRGQRVARKLWQVGRGTGLCRWRWRGPTCVDSGARACFAYRPSNHRDNHESLHRNGRQGSARIECRGAGAQSRVTFARRACARVRAWKAYVCACARAVRRSGQGGSPSPRQVDAPTSRENFFKYILSVWGVNTD